MRVQLIGLIVCGVLSPLASAQFAVQSQFATVTGVGMALDHTTGDVWTYPAFGATLNHYSAAGALLGTLPRPGEAANDADVEFTASPLTLGNTPLPEGTLLFINGETGVADIYAIDKSTGAVLATLNTAFGVSHVVGGAHHPQRGTFFLVQDRVPGGTAANRIAEINAQTGAVLSSFTTTAAAPSFTVNFGDIEVLRSGNLLVVSEDETEALELTPAGSLVALHSLPVATAQFPAGVGVDPTSCEVWVMRVSGLVTRLSITPTGPVCDPCDSIDFNNDGLFPDTTDIDDFLSVFSGGPCSTDPVPGCSDIDFNNDGLFPDTTDIDSLLSVFSGGACL